jgi:lipopolysaccharide heptosyltransferase II
MNIRQIKILDSIIGFLGVLLLAAPARKTSLSQIRSILIIRPGGIGDAILLIPAISALKEKYPDSQVTILAEERNVSAFNLCPCVDQVLHYDKPTEFIKVFRGEYDVVIDTEQWHRLSAVVARLTKAPVSIGYATNERKKLFTHPVSYSHDDYETDSFLKLLAVLGVAKPNEIISPFLIVPETARNEAGRVLESLVSGPFVTIFPGASIPERRWGADKFAAVAQKLSAKGIGVAVVGGEGEAAAGDRIIEGKRGLNLAGKTSLIETAAIIEKSSVLLSGDSGVLHMGLGLGKPTVSLFGPSNIKKWAPRGERNIILDKKLPCSPCSRFGFTPKCRLNAECLADIAVAEVVGAVEKLLGRFPIDT